MKSVFYFAFVLTSLAITTASAQEVARYEKFADFEKAIIKENDSLYVINFWATWCAPCVKELPYFEQLQLGHPDLRVILVSLDSPKDLEKKLLPFLDRKKIKSKTVLLADKDYNHWLPNVNPDWSGNIPATWLIKGKRRLFRDSDFEGINELTDFIQTFNNQ